MLLDLVALGRTKSDRLNAVNAFILHWYENHEPTFAQAQGQQFVTQWMVRVARPWYQGCEHEVRQPDLQGFGSDAFCPR